MSVNNTSYGTSSLNSNSGSNNTALGAYSSYNNLDAYNNTAVGSNSSFFNTTGVNNTAVGAGSLCNNETGSLNTAVGSSALEGVVGQTTGNQNVAIGVQALYTNSANNNTAVGSYALESHTTGESNVAIGFDALKNDTVGIYNTSVGAKSLQNNTTGYHNTAIGYNTLQTSSNGNDNTALGYQAGLVGAFIGNYNTYLGSGTDIQPQGFLPVFEYSTAIGYNAKITSSNQIMLGGTGPSNPTPPDIIIPGNGYLPNFVFATATDDQIVPKSYVDSVAQGLAPKAPCSCVATDGVTITTTGTPPTINVATTFTQLYIIDGYQTSVGDRVLINNQIQLTPRDPVTSDASAAILNGIYTITGSGPYSWVRSPDMPNGSDALGAFCFIDNGDVYQKTNWIQTTKINNTGTPVVVGTNSLYFVRYSSFFYDIGRGLDLFSNGTDTYIQVDTGLNFINYLDSNPSALQPGGATGASGTLNIGTNGTNNVIIGSTGPVGGSPVQFPSGITGATGSFTYLSASKLLSAPAGITGATGSFTYLSASQLLSAPAGITGATGSFTYLSASQLLSAPAGITGATGSFTYLKTSQNALINNVTVGAPLTDPTSTIVGNNALSSQTVATGYNTAVGQDSLKSNTSGSNNTAVGTNTLYVNTSGSNNTAVGGSSLGSNNSGFKNTSIGVNSLLNLIGGNISGTNYGQYDSAIGFEAGYYDVSGNFNTYLGANSGQQLGDTNIYQYSTAVGWGSITTSSNQIMLGGNNGTGLYPLVNAPGGITGATGSFSYLTTSQGLIVNGLLSAPGGITGATGSFTYLSASQLLSAPAGITGATGSFQNVYVSGPETVTGLLSAPAGITGATGSFSYLSTSQGLIVNGLLSAPGGITGATGSFSYLSASQLLSAPAGITGATGSFTYLKTSQNALINNVTVGAPLTDPTSTIVGNNALSSQTVATGYNTAVGQSSLNSNTTGSNNTAVGTNALIANTSGSNNTAVGGSSLSSNNSGFKNTSMGVNSLYNLIGSISYGQYDSAIGYEAGYYDVSGNFNTYLGANSGQQLGDTNIYQYSTAVGWGAITTSSNQIMLGGNNGTGLFPLVNAPGGITGATGSFQNVYVSGPETVMGLLSAPAGITGATGSFSYLSSSQLLSAPLGITGATGSFTYVYASGAVTSTSDYRIKENVTTLDNSYVVDELIPVTYINKLSNKRDMGLIAHELQEVYPFLVNGEKDGQEYQSVNYISLISLLIKEIKELKQKVKKIEEKLNQ